MEFVVLCFIALLGALYAALVLRRLRQLKRLTRSLASQHNALHDAVQNTLAIHSERHLLTNGKLLANSVRMRDRIQSLADVEFSIFSQYGDDGIIQWLVAHLDIPHRTFIEFGVENYRESNTRFLLMNDNWQGLVMDGSQDNIAQIKASEYFPQHELFAITAFLDCENVNELLRIPGFDPEVGILHIDLDGNDYWIWKCIRDLSPIVLILEYNAVFGIDRAITVPYDPAFNRTLAHHSNLYFGASLPAMHALCTHRGYAFIGCNSAGNNAFFVRRDKLNGIVQETSLDEGYVCSRFRESRNEAGTLDCLTGDERLLAIRGMPVFNVHTEQIEPL